ncbi:fructan beta-fructosidase [Breznakia sp. PF5-3]|uniref:GH32 C-terminal domain-containing protein n=1 Tax=unclassified Breznakia TaxID=2623764 RepID=UPI0024074031|nr:MULTISPECIES: GH32 C-terminal domain-containing protein [unclassified Breznakia]MDF9825774.1 fructan beta-fructosidase [Breznakia sp. PM6-1]MDF9836579.1 fructan beta-fructosidase [Breznakia sp. PF5-3]MDF9838807.1 fructan beta-fructosidase [Breznakia sp. PFB2-8]MDF9860833.1 fructan beta-fructosidase [Breznakia sp. PH5-24]
MKKKSYLDRVFKIMFSLAIVFTSMTNLKITADSGEHFYELTNLKGTNVEVINKGYKLHNTGGNNHAISELAAYTFDYEADIELLDTSAALIFGATNKDYKNIGTFFGLEISRDGNAESADIYIKLFQDGSGGLGDGVIEKCKVLSGIDTTQPLKTKVTVNDNKELIITINDQKVDYEMKKDFAGRYVGGYLGLLTWNATANFKNIDVTRYRELENNFITNLSNLRGMNGSWVTSNAGLLSSGNGDNFAISDSEGNDFIYEADVKVGDSGAAALLFRADKDDVRKSYVANINRADKSLRLFKFPSGANVGSATLPNADKETFHIKVIAVGNTFQYYVDDLLLIAGTDNDYQSGRFGLLTWNSTVVYQNVKQTPITASNYPKLTGLELLGDDVILTPEFNEDTIAYAGYIPRKSESIKIKASSDNDLFYSLVDAKGNTIVDKKPLTSGVASTNIDVPVGESNLYVVVKKDDIERTILVKLTRKSNVEDMAREAQRAQFHFSPEINFMNDPNGLVYDPSDGNWHMFYQYSPQVGHMGSQTWGHAVSNDLMSWEEMPVAIPMDELGAIFSGSCVVDEDNTSGFFSDNKPGESKLVAMFTHAGSVQQQSIAYSKDHGVTWTKYDGNPVISNIGTPYGWDFRDPKVFKYDGKWLMVVAGGRGRLFSSDDLKNWQHEQDFTYPDGSELHSECPDLFPLVVEGTGETKWVYNGSSEFYVIGDLKKTEAGGYNFISETYRLPSPTGRTYMYAGQSFYNDGSGQDRRILVSWLQDYSAPGTFPDKRYNGFQSVGTEITLRKVNGEYMLVHNPVEEVDAYRDTLLYEVKNKTVSSKDTNILQNVTGQTYDIEATFTLGSAKEFGFNLRTGNGQKTVLKYNRDTNLMVLDKASSGPVYNEVISWELYPMEGNKIKLRALVDNGVIETYGNDGEANISDLCFPDMDSIGMELFVVDGDVKVDELKVYDMKSMYTGKANGSTGSEPTILSLASPEKVEVGEVFTVSANVYPNSATNKKVTWDYDDKLEVMDQQEGYIVFKAKAKGTYKIAATTQSNAIKREVEVKAIERIFDTNLLDWRTKGGSWEKDEFGLYGKNAGAGDSFYLSDTYLSKDKPFVYEGTLILDSGQAGGLVFGVKDIENPASHWYCVNIDKTAGITKLFKNTGGQNWSVERALSVEEKAKKEFAIKVEYDGKGKLSFYIDGTLAGVQENSGFDGGYFGLVTYRSNSFFNDVYLTSEGKIVAIESMFEDIYVELGSTTTLSDIEATLPNQVIVRQDDDVRRLTDINWDLNKVNLNVEGEYEIVGTLVDSTQSNQEELPKAKIKVIVKKSVVFVGTEPKTITLNLPVGSDATTAFKSLNKKVVALYSDGSSKDVNVTDWKYDAVNFNRIGNYEALGYLDGDTNMTIKIKVNILSKEDYATFKKPSTSPNAGTQTGDTTNISLYFVLLLVGMFGIAYYTRKKAE